MIWNPKAIDYSKGVEIYNWKTGKVYTEEEARQQPFEIRKDLCIRGKVIGCWVYTLDEIEELMKKY